METFQVKSVECPNCGANATNLDNCEYCGSLLVRFKDLNIPIDDSRYGKKAFRYAGLADALKANLEEQGRTDGQNHISTFIRNQNLGIELQVLNPRAAKDIIYFNFESSFNQQSSYHTMPINHFVGDEKSLIICFRFVELKGESFDKHIALINQEYQGRKMRFSAMREFLLFEYVEEKLLTEAGIKAGKCHSYYLDFGQDYEGAASVITQYLQFIYNLPQNQDILLEYEQSSQTEEEYETTVKSVKSSSDITFTLAIVGCLIFAIIFFFVVGGIEGIICGIVCVVGLIYAIAPKSD